jgi:predicted nucleotidyltransferase component of viral defense system
VKTLDFAEIRRLVIIAMFSDDVLYERLVLKGGNAISLVYGIGKRSSLDVDFSIEGEFADLEKTSDRIRRALTDRFDQAGFVVFDYGFGPRPVNPGEKNPIWGGYRAEFKLIPKPFYNKVTGEIEAVRRNAVVIGPAQQRTFTIDISKNEFCRSKAEKEIDNYAVYVYTPAMIAIEKLRAICQQMPEYTPRAAKVARARDFYDISLLVEQGGVDFGSAEVAELIVPVFAAKEVDIHLITRISEYRDFHRQDWPSVEASVAGEIRIFEYYFETVLKETAKITTLAGKKAAT